MDYLPIRVNTLRGDQKTEFDLYIRINDKMLLYIRKGDSFEGIRLQRFKQKKLKKMFILPDDETSYRMYLERNLEMAFDDKSGKDMDTRAEIIQGDMQSKVEELFDSPELSELYEQIKDSAGKFIRFLTANDQAAAAVLKLDNSDRSVSHHGVAVATLAVALARKTDKLDPQILQLMTTGALIHDIGLRSEVFEAGRPISSFDRGELDFYLKHTEVGAQQLQSLDHFDPSVLNIISQHEELTDGTGFPNKLTEKDMDPLAVFVSSANALDRLISFEGIDRTEATKKMMIEQVGKHPLAHIQALHQIIKQE